MDLRLSSKATNVSIQIAFNAQNAHINQFKIYLSDDNHTHFYMNINFSFNKSNLRTHTHTHLHPFTFTSFEWNNDWKRKTNDKWQMIRHAFYAFVLWWKLAGLFRKLSCSLALSSHVSLSILVFKLILSIIYKSTSTSTPCTLYTHITPLIYINSPIQISIVSVFWHYSLFKSWQQCQWNQTVWQTSKGNQIPLSF